MDSEATHAPIDRPERSDKADADGGETPDVLNPDDGGIESFTELKTLVTAL